ncbi:recombination regulator RecX [Thauera linaloolentis]|uniref:Regulatory protein RecX n=1 Tax=Thauera linaloolentis (strain DSM 12138 / JCM 21573 / CCUG 41526 / CIP 105981 / IAM 15112 / NBRC 102519 / 47Lol) TaxID=1123367 RepID=N6XTE2_THAL4|nr:recombination regulator RecX [Thauera linaloolentis]ENO85006.1 regulatory protein RecX [Thauera linaloolentis 47Lol = DSM 12138]MCM8566814.1 recombination regulator RecX [Thauera linaloolentis]
MTEPSLRERALRHLARRDHSRAELAKKLAAHGSAEEVEAVIERMGELGLQSDARFAQAFVRGKSARFGAGRLRSEMARRGLDRDLIDEAIASECGESEVERARSVLRSRFPAPPADAREWARQARFLQTRGFAPDLIRKLLKEPYDESA